MQFVGKAMHKKIDLTQIHRWFLHDVTLRALDLDNGLMLGIL